MLLVLLDVIARRFGCFIDLRLDMVLRIGSFLRSRNEMADFRVSGRLVVNIASSENGAEVARNCCVVNVAPFESGAEVMSIAVSIGSVDVAISSIDKNSLNQHQHHL
jgi:hypothetical protein